MTIDYPIDSESYPPEANNKSDSDFNSSEEEQEKGRDPILPFEPFDIVLMDIQKAAKERIIHCVKKQMAPGVDLKYVAISYRWGELEEEMVRATDYNAHITSFHINDLLKLCDAILEEVDLCTMQYIWVDAICVDQVNETRRKTTIYHMNEIYECANWILAVPDLNLSYWNGYLFFSNVIHWMYDNSDYIYHIIMNNTDHATDIDNEWMRDVIKVPEDLRCYLRTTKDLRSTPHALDELIKRLSLLEEEQSDNNGPPNTNRIYEQIQTWQREVNERYEHICRACTFLEDRIIDWSNRTWVISEYSIARKKNSGIIKFWFISLCGYGSTYARRHYNSKSEPTFRFFDNNVSYGPRTLDDYMSDITQTNTRQPLLFTFDSLHATENFIETSKTEVSTDNFLEMLLTSKATRNSDRFNAILPLFEKYKHYVKDQDTIKNWQITDMVSVRMRVRQWLTVLENLDFLYRVDRIRSGVMLPSFDIKDMRTLLAAYTKDSCYNDFVSGRLNYDLKSSDPPAVIIKDKIDDIDISALGDSPIQLRYSMYLMPKFYRYTAIAFKRDVSDFISEGVWKEIGVDPSVDQLVWLRIPFYLQSDGPQSRGNITCQSSSVLTSRQIHFSDAGQDSPHDLDEFDRKAKDQGNMLDLIGSDTKNVWIVIECYSKLLAKKRKTKKYVDSLHNWSWRKHGNTALRIY